jgi:predicted DNA-binding protein
MIATKKQTEPVRPLSIRLPDSIWKRVHEISDRMGIPLNTFITDALNKSLGDSHDRENHSHAGASSRDAQRP